MITTTQLRLKTSDLVKALANGDTVDIIHRSRLIGEIRPKIQNPKVFNAKKFREAVKKLNLPKLTPRQMEKNYRDHIQKKYGKHLSGH